MNFNFIHAADLHIDSPFAGLGVKDPAVAARFAEAGRKAVERLITEAIDGKAAFLIVAGDIFDGDWKDVTTGLFFARALGRLHRAGIPAFLIKGNHDADSVMSRDLGYPGSVRTFDSRKAETFALDHLRVALHGRSFGGRKVADDFVQSYPARREGWLNIGVLHTALDGTRGHASYAPCTTDDLQRFGYDYWALGHIHAAEVIARNPWIVFPGNLQGRSVRETGPKGAMRVTVEDGRIVDAEQLVVDAARWVHEPIDVTGCADQDGVLGLIRKRLDAIHVGNDGRPLAIRLTLQGMTGHHHQLVARQEVIEDEARAMAFQVAEDCWVEQVKVATTAPPRLVPLAVADDALDLEALLAAAASDPSFAELASGLVASVREKLPHGVREQFGNNDDGAIRGLQEAAHDYVLGSLPR
jgi:DNA repair protein SbcD/Mre11